MPLMNAHLPEPHDESHSFWRRYLARPKWPTLTALFAVVISLLVFLGFMTYTNIKYGRLEAELNAAETLWNNSQISDYQYTIYAAGNEGPSTVRVTVMNGNVVSKENVGYFVASYFAGMDTVPLFFNAIRKAVHERAGGWRADLGLAYSPDFGYPTAVRLYYSPLGLGSSDYPPTYDIRNLHVLKQAPVAE